MKIATKIISNVTGNYAKNHMLMPAGKLCKDGMNSKMAKLLQMTRGIDGDMVELMSLEMVELIPQGVAELVPHDMFKLIPHEMAKLERDCS